MNDENTEFEGAIVVDREGVAVQPGAIVIYPNTRGNLRWGRVLAIFVRDEQGYVAVQPQGETYTVIQDSEHVSTAIGSVHMEWPTVNPMNYNEDCE